MKRILFLDRDGTIIHEPEVDQQVDSLEKLEFLPKAISNLQKIAKTLDYELVMVTNQDGLGTESFPEDQFWLPHNKMLKTLENEDIFFSAIHIDRSFPQQNLPSRKPGTALLEEYIINPNYDLMRSFVIGDRLSDMELAYNLGARGIYIGDPEQGLAADRPEIEEVIELISMDWNEIYQFLSIEDQLNTQRDRSGHIQRKTRETDISIALNLDGTGKSEIHTGIGFFDHMLEQIARHAQLDLIIQVKGDLEIDEHHSIEDTALALGEAFQKALGDKRGIERYGFYLITMDEALAQVALDFSGRPYLIWDMPLKREKVGHFPCEMTEHFFKSFSDQALCNINVKTQGRNDHHMIEATFKAFARAIKMAKTRDPKNMEIPSTKGIL